jgi:mRNA-degrading endonuclease YafQ of YafQ-DinJ toxin-antitoxin module
MRSTTMVTAAAGAVACAAGLVVSAPVGQAVASGSIECYAAVEGVTAKGVPATFRFENGNLTTQKRGPDSLGYQPRDIAHPHYAAGSPLSGSVGRAARVKSYWFTLSGSQLSEVTEVSHRDAQGRLVSTEYRTRVVRKNWEGVRQMSIGADRNLLYVLTNEDQLLRYRLTGKDGNTTVKYAGTVGVGFGTIGTFEYARTITPLGLSIDVFLATDADSGELIEFGIPRDEPTSYARTVLADTGWADMRTAGRTASCLNPKNDRSYGGIVAVALDSGIKLWTDSDPRDGDGADIAEWGVLKSAWKPMPYND